MIIYLSVFHLLNNSQSYQLTTKEEDVNNNITDLTHMKEDIRATAERCAELYIEYSDKRKQVLNFIVCYLLGFSQEML